MSNTTTKRGVAALLASAVVASVLSVSAASAATCNYTFNTNLKKGSKGVDVMNLQKVLNMDAATAVSTSGAGSAGNETTLFGSATHLAVIKFQEKYASEILTPVGLTKGTGLVYASTRAKLNAVCANGGSTTTNPGTTTSGPVSVSNGAMFSNSIVAGQAGAKLADFVFSGNGTVTNLELMRTGVSTNSTLSNVYLYDGATRLTDSASVTSDGRITFNAPQGLFAVAGSKTITVRADISGSTNGQTVGVAVSKMTPMGGSSATVSGVMGNNQLISSVSTASVSIANGQTGVSTNINAGLVNQNVWDATFNVGVREVWMKGLTFKYIGSAPTDALSNLALYVDGVKVKDLSLQMVNGNTIAVADLMSAPQKLMTGARLVQLRADVVKGTSRSFQFQVQNNADYMLEDSNLSGVFVTPTYSGGAGGNNSGNGNNFQIQNGSLTINQEPSFTDTKVVGGATNATIAKYKVQAFGEDVKVETVTVTPVEVATILVPGSTSVTAATLTAGAQTWTVGDTSKMVVGETLTTVGATTNAVATITSITNGTTVVVNVTSAGAGTASSVSGNMLPTSPKLQNVTLYANGAAVGSSQNWTSGALTFNLGSSFIVPAGATQMLEVKADMRDNSGAAYSKGTVRADLSTTLLRGQSSQNTLTNVGPVQGRVLTVTTGTATFAKTGGFLANTVSPNSSMVKLGSFTLQAGDAEDIRVTNMAVALTFGAGMTATNLTNMKVTDSSTTVFNPVAGTNNFTMDIVVPKSTSKTFEVWADLGSANGGTATVQANATATYRGVGTGNSNSTLATGVVMTANNAAIASTDVTKLSSSPVQQLVVGGTTNSAIVTYNVKTTGGTGSATITDMTFTVAPSADAITKVTVGGKSATVVGTQAVVNGLSIAVPSGSAGIDVPVTVDYGNVMQPGGIASQTTAASIVTLSEIKYTSGTSAATLTGLTVASNGMQLVGTKPTITVPNTNVTGLSLSEVKIGEVTVAADSKGNLKVNRFVFDVSTSGGPTVTAATARIADGSTTISGSSCAGTTTITCDFGTSTLTDGDGYTIAAGASKTFSLYATIGGTLGSSGTSAVSTKLQAGATGISWDDVNGAGTNLTGANVYNYPTGSYSVKN